MFLKYILLIFPFPWFFWRIICLQSFCKKKNCLQSINFSSIKIRLFFLHSSFFVFALLVFGNCGPVLFLDHSLILKPMIVLFNKSYTIYRISFYNIIFYTFSIFVLFFFLFFIYISLFDYKSLFISCTTYNFSFYNIYISNMLK